MADPNSINPTHMLMRGLDGLALRQRVTANNVANAETPGFKASSVRFEDALKRAMVPSEHDVSLVRTNAMHLTTGGANATGLAAPVVETSSTALRNDGNSVDIEREMGQLADTNLRFNALSETLARRFAMQRMVASDGRG